MNTAILLAAGSSSRAGQNKLWADVHGKPLWTLSYETLQAHPEIDRIVLVVPKGDEFRFLPFIEGEKTQVTTGGSTRMDSFKCGLAVIEFKADDILIDHNAANPNVTMGEISEVIEVAKKTGAAAVSQPAVDTLLTADHGVYTVPVPRENIRLMQTPQAVRGDILQKTSLHESTDLSSALLAATSVAVVDASPLNKKITFAEDLAALQGRSYLGEDSHEFSDSGTLVLAGLNISGFPALEANSDGDVILHAIGRALAQACGENFSEVADPLMLSGDQDSRDYLETFLQNIRIQQVSLSLECARPQIDPIASDIKNSLGRILQIEASQIHISAHTGEGLTPFGRGEGIRCLALVTVLPLN